jgi:dephospho-CoA kinase
MIGIFLMIADTVEVSEITDMKYSTTTVLLIHSDEEIRITREHRRAVSITNNQYWRNSLHDYLSGDECNQLLSV